MKLRLGIRAQLMALLLSCALLPLLAASYGSYQSAKTALIETTKRELEFSGRQAFDQISSYFADILVDLKTWSTLRVMQDVLIEDEAGEILMELDNLRRAYPEFAELAVIGPGGQVVATTHREGDPAVTLDPQMIGSVMAGEIRQVKATASGPLEQYYLVFAMPISAEYDPAIILGALVGVIDWPHFRGQLSGLLIAGAQQDRNHFLMLVDRANGIVLFQTPGTDNSFTKTMRHHFGPRGETMAGSHELDGPQGDVMVEFAVSRDEGLFADPQWELMVGVTRDVVLATARQLKKQFVVIAGFLALLTIVVGWIGGSWIVEPLQKMIASMSKLAKGDHQSEIPSTRRSDEIGEMGKALQVFGGAMRDQARQHEILRAQKAAEVASRAKSEFLATMSHEIRTPMNGVMGMIGMLLRTELKEHQIGLARTARDSARDLLTILDDVMNYSKLEEGWVKLERVSFSPEEVLDSVASLLQPQMEDKELEFSLDLPCDLPRWVEGDPTRWRQILINLVGNATKFTDAGFVRVTAAHRAVGDDDLELRVAVSDSGIGIPEEALEGLFRRFSQADSTTTRRFGGSGLGLAISKQLVELMGGEIGVESVPGSGSTFWFTIRCKAGAPPQTSGPSKAQVVRPGRRLRILVAEDNPVNQVVVQAFVEAEGHRVHVVSDGLQAVEAVKSENYDLVLMDVSMPEMNGTTAARIIRGLKGEISNIPIIALTANAMAEHREEAQSAGMNDFVTKPFEPNDLLAAIARVA
jgi:signal transduction histidine kinase/ActR/RegA family two-component response regulator